MKSAALHFERSIAILKANGEVPPSGNLFMDFIFKLIFVRFVELLAYFRYINLKFDLKFKFFIVDILLLSRLLEITVKQRIRNCLRGSSASLSSRPSSVPLFYLNSFRFDARIFTALLINVKVVTSD